jgi:hypothetical protein
MVETYLHSVTAVRFISLCAIFCRYIHNQDWENAQRVAEDHDPESVTEVLLGQAKDVFNSKNYPQFESLLLRAQKPELIIKHYKVRPREGWTVLFIQGVDRLIQSDSRLGSNTEFN